LLFLKIPENPPNFLKDFSGNCVKIHYLFYILQRFHLEILLLNLDGILRGVWGAEPPRQNFKFLGCIFGNSYPKNRPGLGGGTPPRKKNFRF